MIFKQYFSHPFCKKGLGLPARKHSWPASKTAANLLFQFTYSSMVMAKGPVASATYQCDVDRQVAVCVGLFVYTLAQSDMHINTFLIL
jgi:hypothetical protein